VRLRTILQRVVRDDRVLESNRPDDLLNRDIHKAMIYLDLQAKNRLRKRQGLDSDDSEDEAVEFDKKDLTVEKVKILNKTIGSMSEIIEKLEKEY